MVPKKKHLTFNIFGSEYCISLMILFYVLLIHNKMQKLNNTFGLNNNYFYNCNIFTLNGFSLVAIFLALFKIDNKIFW